MVKDSIGLIQPGLGLHARSKGIESMGQDLCVLHDVWVFAGLHLVLRCAHRHSNFFFSAFRFSSDHGFASLQLLRRYTHRPKYETGPSGTIHLRLAILFPMARKALASKRPKNTSSTGLILIGLFKLAKALMLIAVGIGALKLLHRDIAETVTHWVNVLRVDPDNRFIHRILAKVFAVTPKQLKALSAGTFFYAALLLTEGVGLLLKKHSAEYFTVITTAALLPFEIYELVERFTGAKVAVLVINVAIVWYLVVRLRASRSR